MASLFGAFAAAAQEKLNVGALRLVSNGALFVAAERGYFKAEGLDVGAPFSSGAFMTRDRASFCKVISTEPVIAVEEGMNRKSGIT